MLSGIHAGFELQDAFEGGSETWEDQSGFAPRQAPSYTLRTEQPIGRCLPLRQKSKGFFPKAIEQIVWEKAELPVRAAAPKQCIPVWLVSVLLKLERNLPEEGPRLQTQRSGLCHCSVLYKWTTGAQGHLRGLTKKGKDKQAKENDPKESK